MPKHQALLVMNAGSSSFKYQVFSMPEEEILASGLVERIGEPAGKLVYNRYFDGELESETRHDHYPTHAHGMREIADMLLDPVKGVLENKRNLIGIGHRVLLGGPHYTEVLIDQKVKDVIREYAALGPLHNPANLMGIEVMEEIFPGIPNVAVFDTGFHATMPNYAYTYAIPKKLAHKHQLRRYGFHGTSHKYVSRKAAEFLGIPLKRFNAITCHLGNGSSVAAILKGKCVDTSMGLTPLEGLVMGTRSGDLDPSILIHLMRHENYTVDGLHSLLNKESGLKGICGHNDMRDLLAARATGDADAELAFAMFCYRLKKYIGSYLAALGKIDALVFTGGIGENAHEVREETCEGLENFGLCFDAVLNENPSRDVRFISQPDSPTAILVIPTNEELEIARSTMGILKKTGHIK